MGRPHTEDLEKQANIRALLQEGKALAAGKASIRKWNC